MEIKDKLVVFQDKKIRRMWHEEEWFFSIVDIVAVLTGSIDATAYWRKLKERLKDEGNETVTNCHALKMRAQDGKMRLTDVGTTKEIFRLIQSIPSKKAEPFKQWLAQVGYERIEEIENPEVGQDRIKTYYEMKGYPKEWIDKRLRGIAVRQELTDEWKNRDVKTEKEFGILTNEISKATFGKTVLEYKEFKRLQRKNQNLRDHMTDWELILTMVGEKATTDITREKDSQGFDACKDSADKGGSIAKRTREDIEKNIGRSIVSDQNFLPKRRKRLK
ncbi:MAG: Bro-N domain-containing protein [Nanoarchaeota archaeon]